MVADELALSIVSRFVPKLAKVLDPFCGSGRLLAAAEGASLRVGVDANPLAWLLTKAKFANSNRSEIAKVILAIKGAQIQTPKAKCAIDPRRKVEWFPNGVADELCRIVSWLNGLKLAESEQLLVAAALSATVRDVSFARKQGWKLHRIDFDARSLFRPCPWDQFQRRLTYCLGELTERPSSTGKVLISLANAKSLAEKGQSQAADSGPFDVVLTSPPYGDSQSTVQYGAASSLCLSIVAGLNGLEHLDIPGRDIDNSCLGGTGQRFFPAASMKKYWAGAAGNRFGRGIAQFLSDYDEVCTSVAFNVKPGGKAIFIVGRRSTGGYRLKLDEFTIDRLSLQDFDLVCTEERKIRRKQTPRMINRFARDPERKSEATAQVLTMTSEVVVVMKKRATVSRARHEPRLWA